MKDYVCSEDRFLKDTAEHKLTVLRDDGLNKHLQFKKEDTYSYWFDIVTWDGVLVIRGDMGSYMFSRISDMMDFFRIKPHDWNFNKEGLSINPSYWGEKLLAVNNDGCGKGAIEKFSSELFDKNVKEWYDNYYQDQVEGEIDDLTRAQQALVECDGEDKDYYLAELTKVQAIIAEEKTKREEVWGAIQDALYYCESYEEKYKALNDLDKDECPINFTDFYECNTDEYTFHYIWCCYAIAKAVQMYDEYLASIKEAVHE